jgi:DNA-binding NarL/FixJ family response regulator
LFTILIIDDNIPFRRSLRQTLEGRFPFVVIEEASRGKEGLKKIDNCLPHLIFMDFHLPDITGLNLTRQIKTGYCNTCVVVFTTHDLPEYRTAALESGADHFVAKDSWTGNKSFELVESVLSNLGFDRNGLTSES